MNSDEFKNKLRERLQGICEKQHFSVSRIPLKVQEVISKGKMIAVAYTEKAYVNVVNYFRYTYPEYPMFNPCVVYFS